MNYKEKYEDAQRRLYLINIHNETLKSKGIEYLLNVDFSELGASSMVSEDIMAVEDANLLDHIEDTIMQLEMDKAIK